MVCLVRGPLSTFFFFIDTRHLTLSLRERSQCIKRTQYCVHGLWPSFQYVQCACTPVRFSHILEHVSKNLALAELADFLSTMKIMFQSEL